MTTEEVLIFYHAGTAQICTGLVLDVLLGMLRFSRCAPVCECASLLFSVHFCVNVSLYYSVYVQGGGYNNTSSVPCILLAEKGRRSAVYVINIW